MQKSKTVEKLRTHSPRVGAIVTTMAAFASALTPYTPTILATGGVVAVGTTLSLLHGVSESISRIDTTIEQGVEQLTTATADSDGTSYMRDLGPGIRSASALLEQTQSTHLVDKIAAIDFDKVSALLSKLEKSDIEGLLDGIANIVEQFDRVSLLANVRFSTDEHAIPVGGTAARNSTSPQASPSG